MKIGIKGTCKVFLIITFFWTGLSGQEEQKAELIVQNGHTGFISSIVAEVVKRIFHRAFS